MCNETILEIWGGGGVMVGEYSVSNCQILAICILLSFVGFVLSFIYLTIFY